MDGYAGRFSLAAPVEGHPAGTLVQVTVSVTNSSRLVLAFSNQHQVLTDACVLLCGSIGSLVCETWATPARSSGGPGWWLAKVCAHGHDPRAR